MLNVEQAIREVTGVYQSVAGRPIQAGRTELPPEVDPRGHVEARYAQFKRLIESRPIGTSMAPPEAWSPAMDVFEQEREVRYELDVPGVTREQLTVNVSGDWLVVRGHRALSAAGVARHLERRPGPFQKLAALPPRARREGIEATLRDGVLVVIVPCDGTNGEASEAPIEIK